jgi:hypothetical protein
MASVEMKLKPWQTPNFASIEAPPRPKGEGFTELPSIPITELSAAALSALAEEWLTSLYQKAGKAQDWSFHR